MTWHTGAILILAVYSVTATIWGALDRRETRREARRTRIALETLIDSQAYITVQGNPPTHPSNVRRLWP